MRGEGHQPLTVATQLFGKGGVVWWGGVLSAVYRWKRENRCEKCVFIIIFFFIRGILSVNCWFPEYRQKLQEDKKHR